MSSSDIHWGIGMISEAKGGSSDSSSFGLPSTVSTADFEVDKCKYLNKELEFVLIFLPEPNFLQC